MAVALDPSLLSTIVSERKLDGDTSLQFRSGNVYTGELADQTTMHGAGIYRWSSAGVTYAGEFASNKLTGRGKYSWADGSTYEGELRAGVRHGVGTFSGPGGHPKYEGQWVEGRRHGKGMLTYSDGGDVYEGEFANDQREGSGTLTHGSGNSYTGQWVADQKCGQGVFEWRDRRERYTGQWHDGKPHGQGEHIWLRRQLEASPFQLQERYAPAANHTVPHPLSAPHRVAPIPARPCLPR